MQERVEYVLQVFAFALNRLDLRQQSAIARRVLDIEVFVSAVYEVVRPVGPGTPQQAGLSLPAAAISVAPERDMREQVEDTATRDKAD